MKLDCDSFVLGVQVMSMIFGQLLYVIGIFWGDCCYVIGFMSVAMLMVIGWSY